MKFKVEYSHYANGMKSWHSVIIEAKSAAEAQLLAAAKYPRVINARNIECARPVK